MSKLAFLITTFLAIGALNAQVPQSNRDIGKAVFETEIFESKIRPLLVTYCASCHAPGDMKDMDFLSIAKEADLAKHRDLFATVVQQITSGAMPPRGEEQASASERKLIVDWLTNKLQLKPSETERISQYVVATFQDKKGNLWFGTMYDGAARYDGKTLKYFTEEDGLPTSVVTCFAEDKAGNLWVGTHAGICKLDGEKFTRIALEKDSGGVAPRPTARNSASIQADRDGNLWASVAQKVYRYQEGSFKEFEMPIDVKSISSYAILPGRVSLRLQDKAGNLWFGTDGAGAFKFDGKRFTQFTKKNGLCSNNVNGIIEDKQGNIWFACMQSHQPTMTGDGGVCRFDGESFTKFPHVKGLSNNDIYSILASRTGDVWIGATGVGAYRYRNKTFTLFDKTDKPLWTRYFGVQDILEDRNGTLWFGFSGGLFRFNGKSFFNVTKKGPWTDSVSSLPDAAKGDFTPIAGRKRYENLLVAPKNWLEEVIVVPPSFAPTMSLTGLEHLRLPPEFRNPKSDWFISYLFVIELSEPAKLNETLIGEQLLCYFRGLASGSVSKDGKKIDTNRFTIEPQKLKPELEDDEYIYELSWREPFAGGTPQIQNIRVKVSTKLNKQGVIFVCVSPQPWKSDVWNELLSIRTQFLANQKQ